ncbi:hypothetical protein GJ496_012040 [Pomphorhynchus laevis]|nr:hypothetical protein GJ496_012040 [Pomphorhynchus laevis]
MKTIYLIALSVIFVISYIDSKRTSSKVHKGIDKKSASKFLSFKDCMKMMKCGPSLYSECAEECSAGNTIEEIEEHTERLKNIKDFTKDARNKKLMSKRLDTDFSDSSSSDDSDSEERSHGITPKHEVCKLSNKVKEVKVPNPKAAMFLSYKECMKRMNCGKHLQKECSEECKEGNTEEEVEEHGSFLRNIDKYIAEAKRRQQLNDLGTSDTDSDTSDSSSADTSSNDDDSDDTSDNTDSDDNTA